MATPALLNQSPSRHHRSSSLPTRAHVLFTACFGVFAGFGSLFISTFGVFLKPLSVAFGWTRSQVSIGFTVAVLSVAICSPFLGRLLDRYPARRIVIPCTLVYALGFASLALLTPHLWHFVLVLGLMGIVGNGTTQLGYARVVSAWFDESRGRALAAVMAGSGIGFMVFPPLAQALISHYGWRWAFAVLGSMVLLTALPLSLAYLYEPADKQSSPTTQPAPNLKSAKGAAAHRPGAKEHTGPSGGALDTATVLRVFLRSAKDAAAHRQGGKELASPFGGALGTATVLRVFLRSEAFSLRFLLILCALLLFSLATNGLNTHWAALLTDRGLTPGTAAAVLSAAGFATLISKLSTGYLIDRFFAAKVAACLFALCACGFIAIIYGHQLWLAFAAAALVGIGMGAESDTVPYLLTRYFGLHRFSELYGYTWTIYAIAGGLGPLLAGAIFDQSGSYRTALFIFLALVLISAVIFAALPRYPETTPPTSAAYGTHQSPPPQ